MIAIDQKTDCCGCSACASVCPRGCISMRADGEGFLYPVVNEADCTRCGLCLKVCPELHPYEDCEPVGCFAAMNCDDKVRLRSSSGGIFRLLAQRTVSEGGVVFGARFDAQWQVVMDFAETLEGVDAFMGSKYVQARTGRAYSDAKHFLEDGRKVLFSGTPCQIAGLHHFLRRPYVNLLTVDVACHGTPSPKVWSRYLDEVTGGGRNGAPGSGYACSGADGLRVCDWRNGLRAWGFEVTYNEEDRSVSLLSPFRENLFMRGFIKNLILRPSCYDCRVKGGRSHSDITLADFWGVETVLPEMDDDRGTSLVLVNTEKGSEALDWDRTRFRETGLEQAVSHNFALLASPASHPGREAFFMSLDGCTSVNSLLKDSLRPTPWQKLRLAIWECKIFIKRMLSGNVPQKNIAADAGKRHASGAIPVSFPEDASVVSVRFRNKARGWKEYNLEIRMK
ncbi:MAG: Coenzyme F420 hydrogenase/dehydrogenase, beta subunit C-terminal domain [Candidatus Cryptobacteroides sp.]